MTKKYIYILFSSFVLFLFFSFKGEKTISVFNEYEYIDDYKFDNYILTFDDCELNLSNFKDVFSYFNDLEFKILEIVPYKNDNIKYLYYSDNLDYIISNFKSKYLDSVIDKSSYITNICIKNVKINTANKYISEFRNKKK